MMKTLQVLLSLLLLSPIFLMAQVRPTTRKQVQVNPKDRIQTQSPQVNAHQVRPQLELARPGEQPESDSVLATRVAENYLLARAYLSAGEFGGRGGWTPINFPPQFIKARELIEQARQDWLKLKDERLREELWNRFKIDLKTLESLAGKIPIQWQTVSLELLPQLPWPPPRASGMAVISEHYFTPFTNYGEVNELLCEGLNNLGYHDRSYYAVPNGFAIVTRLEQIERDGRSMDRPARWQTQYQSGGAFSLVDYLKSLFSAPVGYFRLIILVVTDQPFSQSASTMSDTEGLNLLASGANSLPDDVEQMTFGADHEVTALIYEFEKRQGQDDGRLMLPGSLTGVEHLERSGIKSQIDRQSRSIR